MRLLFVVFIDARHGMGHWYRTQAVIDEAVTRGHDVRVANNTNVTYYLHDINRDRRLESIICDACPDWIILDLLDPLPSYIMPLTRKYNAKIALLNGVGRVEEQHCAHLVWVQNSPLTIILRPRVLKLRKHGGDKWFVWGGASDELGLCNYFMNNFTDPAWLITTRFAPPLPDPPSWQQQVVCVEGDDILHFMSISSKAAIHMGMTAWELARLGIPIYLFSKDEGHLHFARNMEKLGLARVYPRIGLPRAGEMMKFLGSEFTPNGKNRPDGKGAERFLIAIEDL